MDLNEFKIEAIKKLVDLDFEKFGNIFAFVDFGNVRHWAKGFWPIENKHRLSLEIDIEKLYFLIDVIMAKRKFFYYGHYAIKKDLSYGSIENIKYRKSLFRIDKADKVGFKIRTKEIKMIPHYDEEGKFLGKFPKCNFDVEITMDILKQVHKYDTVMLFSGDSDFGGLLEYIKSKGKKVIVICPRDNMSTELEAVADKFISATIFASYLKFDQKTTPPVKAEE